MADIMFVTKKFCFHFSDVIINLLLNTMRETENMANVKVSTCHCMAQEFIHSSLNIDRYCLTS